MKSIAIIIGAGPAGLTAAYELLKRTDVMPVIFEKSGDIGGISKTVNYKGNRMDMGGHRFFSKSDRVMNWWLEMMPMEKEDATIHYHHQEHTVHAGQYNGVNGQDKVFLVRNRLSRIYFLRRFFSYPIQLSFETLKKLGVSRTLGILTSYMQAQLFPIKQEKSLEDFMINRFGRKLYLLFFKDYTEKVWGVPCSKISAEWGAQRIKGISVWKALVHAMRALQKKKKTGDIGQKDTETSLIERFLYPKYGPGQLWEEVARQVQARGGIILMHHDVTKIYQENNHITGIDAVDSRTGESKLWRGDYFFSTMPVQELVKDMNGVVPPEVKEIAAGLQYRDFITVGILLKQFSAPVNGHGHYSKITLEDTWIYIQEKDVKVGRLQLFNNWSPYMVKDTATTWVGMEYFCNKDDEFWNQPDHKIQQCAVEELRDIGLARVEDVLDTTIHRLEKTYPAYFGTYDRFDRIREFTDRFENLFLVGRNGMHKYNNTDHSMLTAMVAVDNIVAGIISKANIWDINTEQEYHEEKNKK
jgi:protoporphyrinogen oxidase